MITKTNKFLTLLIAAIMIISTLSYAVVADEPEILDETLIVAEDTVTEEFPAIEASPTIDENPTIVDNPATPLGAVNTLLYNYKRGWDSGADIVNSSKWKPEIGGKPKDPSVNVVAAGRFASCLALKYYSLHVPGANYGSTIEMTLPTTTAVVLKPRTDWSDGVTALLGDAMHGFKNLGMWVKLEWDREKAEPSMRTFKIAFGTASGGFTANVSFMASDEWQYIVIPASSFVGGGTNLDASPDAIRTVTKMTISTEVFRENGLPGYIPVDGGDETSVVLYLDEFTFDKTTPTNRPYTRPSPGEESQFSNNELKSVAIAGVPVSGIEGSDGSVPIDIELPYGFDATKEADRAKVVAIPKHPDIPIDNPDKVQIQMGANATVNYPDALPGKGTIVVESGSGVKRTYTANFFESFPCIITDASDGAVLSSGVFNKVFSVRNLSSQPINAAVIGVLRNRDTGALQDITYRAVTDIAPNSSRNLTAVSLRVPADPQNYEVEYIFCDNIIGQKKLAAPIYVNKKPANNNQ